jgi:hypothetical protein
VADRNTLETSPATTVLVVGAPAPVAEGARLASRAIPGAHVVECELKLAATRVAELWPFAIVMTEDLYAFDAAEFDALARDVSGRLITTSATATTEETERKLRPLFVEAHRRRGA